MTRPSVPVRIELVCAECADQFPGEFVRRMDLEAGPAKTRLVQRALDVGWVRAHDEIFCNKDHADTYGRRMKNP